ncbi:MAG TPA: hypothetical protein PKC28_02775 [Bdellovibrionales bacterium]|nr:hypothetical protein [Bdellovibrionales bacterium]
MKYRTVITVLPAVALLAITLHYWGITTYFIGAFGPGAARSQHSSRTKDIRLASGSAGGALLLHGLNFDAEGLRELSLELNAMSLNVLTPRLHAHRGAEAEMFMDSLPVWRAQIATWADEIGRPLVCVGYSLGALLLLERHAAGAIVCDVFVGFSPAFALRAPDWFIRGSRAVLPDWARFPSAIPVRYRHFDNVGLGPSYALHDSLVSLRSAAARPSELRGLIFMDERDEVVDARGVRAFVDARFPHFEWVSLRAAGVDERHAHHLLVDERHVGPQQWRLILDKIRKLIPR